MIEAGRAPLAQRGYQAETNRPRGLPFDRAEEILGVNLRAVNDLWGVLECEAA